MLNRTINIIKFIEFTKKTFEKIVFQNITKNASFNERKFSFFSFAMFFMLTIFVSFTFINLINQLIQMKFLKTIKSMNKKNVEEKKKRQRKISRKKRIIKNIDADYFREAFKGHSTFFEHILNMLANVVVIVVLSNSLIKISIVDEIINEFVA